MVSGVKLAKLKKNGRLKIDRNNRVEPLVDAIIQNGKVLSTTLSATRLDLGCGPGKKPGFIGVDQTAFPGVDVVCNLAEPIYAPFPSWKDPDCVKLEGFERKPMGYVRWPWETSSVEEAHSSHCLEHFDAMERVHFLNELYRVLKPGAKATIICPHWASCRAYGDPTHKWPPVSEFAWFYLKREWRMANAPHTDYSNLKGGYNVNFEVTWGYSLEPGVAMRNPEYQQIAMTYYKEACQDMIATLTALK